MIKIGRYMAILMMAVLYTGCHINEMKVFEDYYMAFDTSKSSSTTVNEAGEFSGNYVIHFCTVRRDGPVSVTVEVIPGDGLKENVDYRVMTQPVVTFAPGVYDKTFIVEWLPNPIDASKDNSLTLRLKECSDASVILGMPGPDENFRSVRIYKTK